MKEKEIEWIVNWIKRNPKQVEIADRKKFNNIINYLYSIDITLNDFKDILKLNSKYKDNKNQYFKNKTTLIFLNDGTGIRATSINIDKIIIEESGRIEFKQPAGMFVLLDDNDGIYLDGYKYDWSVNRSDLIETIDLSNKPNKTGVTVIPARGTHKNLKSLSGTFPNGGMFPSIDWEGFLKNWKKFIISASYIDSPHGLPDEQDCQDMIFTDIDFDTINGILGGDDK